VVFTGASVLLDRYVAQDHDDDGSTKLDKDAATTERTSSAAAGSGSAGLALLAA
jgi:hypothetical protein